MKILKILFLGLIISFVAKQFFTIYFQNENKKQMENKQIEMTKHNDSIINNYKRNLSVYNIDSLTASLQKDIKYNILSCHFRKEDSILYIFTNPVFNYSDTAKCREFFNAVSVNHKLEYASNIALFIFVKPIIDKNNSISSVEVLYEYAGYCSRYYTDLSNGIRINP
jgi:hypothetical protein